MKDDTISPKVGLIFDVNNKRCFTLAYSEAFAPKSGDQYAKLADNTKIDPDSFENLEFGVKYDLANWINPFSCLLRNRSEQTRVDDGTGNSSSDKIRH